MIIVSTGMLVVGLLAAWTWGERHDEAARKQQRLDDARADLAAKEYARQQAKEAASARAKAEAAKARQRVLEARQRNAKASGWPFPISE